MNRVSWHHPTRQNVSSPAAYSVLIGFGTYDEFRNRLMSSTEVSLLFIYNWISSSHKLHWFSHLTLKSYVIDWLQTILVFTQFLTLGFSVRSFFVCDILHTVCIVSVPLVMSDYYAHENVCIKCCYPHSKWEAKDQSCKTTGRPLHN